MIPSDHRCPWIAINHPEGNSTGYGFKGDFELDVTIERDGVQERYYWLSDLSDALEVNPTSIKNSIIVGKKFVSGWQIVDVKDGMRQKIYHKWQVFDGEKLIGEYEDLKSIGEDFGQNSKTAQSCYRNKTLYCGKYTIVKAVDEEKTRIKKEKNLEKRKGSSRRHFSYIAILPDGTRIKKTRITSIMKETGLTRDQINHAVKTGKKTADIAIIREEVWAKKNQA